MLEASQKISNSFRRSAQGGGRGIPRHSERSEGSALHPRHSERSEESVPPQPDPAQIKRLLSGAEGQALLRILQADGGAGIRAASAALQGGDMEAARAALTPLLTGTDAEELTKRIEAQL